MFIYSVTININDDIHQEWLLWMKEVHIPGVMSTGCFESNRMLKVLFVNDDGHTYSIQYSFREMSDLERYNREFGLKLQADHASKFKNKFVAFRTILEVI